MDPILLPSAPAPLSALPSGTVLTALVQQVLIPGQRYQVDIRGLLLELEMELLLQVGERVPLRVAESGPRGLVLTAPASPPPPEPPPLPEAAEAALRAAGLPAREETERAARALTTVGARPAPELVQAVVDAVRALPPEPGTPPPAAARDAAVAYLVSRGLPPSAEFVRRLAPILAPEPAPPTAPEPAPPTAPAPDLPPPPRDVLEALRPPPVDLPQAVQAKTLPADLQAAAERAAAAPELLREAVARAIQASPVLAALDTALAELEVRATTAPEPAADVAERLVRELLARLAAAPDGEEVRRLLRELPPAPLLTVRLREALLKAEHAELVRLPGLRVLREALSRPELAESVDRAAAVRVLNVISGAQGEGLTVVEVPLWNGESSAFSRALLIFRRAGRQGAGYEGFDSFTVDVWMSRIGRVIGQIALSRQAAGIRFRVRGTAERRLFEAHARELTDALSALGLSASMTVEVRGEGADHPSLPEDMRRESTFSVDTLA